MGIDAVRDRIINDAGFRDRLMAVITDSVAGQFDKNAFSRSELASTVEHDWQYLLLVASLFSGSARGEHQDVALRIAQHCLLSEGTADDEKAAAGVILSGLANFPALHLATTRDLLPPADTVRQRLFSRLQEVRCRLETAAFLSNGTVLELNRFQHAFWKALTGAQWLSVSAPTSAGKSFVVTRWLVDTLSDASSTCVYVVPTRALIHQVETDLQKYANERARSIHVTSIPRLASIKRDRPTILVLTQERLHLLLNELGNAKSQIHFMVVDEAQRIGDRHRGVMLQLVIEQVVVNSPLAKVVFIAPMTENPGAMHSDLNRPGDAATIESDEVTVNQNLIWVSQLPRKTKLWEVSLCLSDRTIPLGTLTLPQRPTPDSKRLPFVAAALSGPRGGNIVYVNGAAEAEKTAEQLFDLLGREAEIAANSKISELVDLVDQVIHKKYRLRRVLARGIAFHYGNMPLIVRSEVERLFSAGDIRFLVCTSTLVEGVNTACRTIAVRGPKKGRGTPMTAEDFWNLAGRAGRLGKEFQGNIVCVDANRPHLWEGGSPPRSRVKYRVERTTDQILLDPGELLEFISSDTPRSDAEQRPDLEYVFSYLMAAHAQYGSVLKAPWSERLRSESLIKVNEAIAGVWERLTISPEVVSRNPGVSPIALQSLLEYFRERTNNEQKPIEELLPAEPASDDAVDNYTAIISRCAKYISKSLGPLGPRPFILAILVTRWMKGIPLARIIEDREYYWTQGDGSKRNGRKPDLPTIIRSVLEDVEQVARFEAPRAFSAYNDVLRLFLLEQERSDLITDLDDVAIYLELGVSLPTQISLIAIGLSRSTAIRLSELIASDSLSEEECREWLNQYPIEESDLPRAMKDEIASAILLAPK